MTSTSFVFQKGQYDLLLVDWMLPEMDGIAICRNVRLVSDMPIIMISARKEDADKVEGLDRGADDYLAKTFSLAELKARVTS
ncbi:response regulator transcription factor [Sporosarcina pasteurii]|uniref:Transcriptional regulatory protein YycF n=1 Tax=Sporosarcina pasteurii TaxID=1474 RepID=A0A380CHT2_SPOPA|nr:response regulator transcription factor [Sporosarcina pasteurii]MDS9472099.1 response regulator transcription factor [Sporosarcina pasteurii]SUJ20798.1 Transcriptional regulatory protein YycF [Sporosarcina pasteurii]